jgi:DNA-binding NtrC family response regulator
MKQRRPRILLVEDDAALRDALATTLELAGYGVCPCGDVAAAEAVLDQGGIAAVVTDFQMKPRTGLDLLRGVRSRHGQLPVLMITAHGSIEHAVQSMLAGASDYLAKPFPPERLLERLARLMPPPATATGSLVAADPATLALLDLARRVARTDATVLITGESGTGKEVVARFVHQHSARLRGPFVAINCAAIPENMLEALLFGHEKGAFTGAHDKHLGKFQEANGGTLFLDEIGELRLDMQVKLLRAIQQGEIDPVGSKRPVKIDIRLISATNRTLQDMVAQGSFREDLFYRLNVFPIAIPPLRQRKDDIPPLAAHFIARFAVEEGKKVLGLERDALELLLRYDWPGNIRQLENAIFRAVVLADAAQLRVADFPHVAAQMGVTYEVPAFAPSVQIQPAQAAPEETPDTAAGPAAPLPVASGEGPVAVKTADGHVRRLEDVEHDLIRHAIARYEGQMSEVARRLGIGRSTLYRKLREMGIETGDSAAA